MQNYGERCDQRPFPDRRGGDEAALPGLASGGGRLENAAARVARSQDPVRYHVRPRFVFSMRLKPAPHTKILTLPSCSLGQRNSPSSNRLATRTTPRAIPEHQLDAIRALGAEHVYGARERIGPHGVAHERGQSIGPLRKSTGLVATRTRTVPLGPIIAGS